MGMRVGVAPDTAGLGNKGLRVDVLYSFSGRPILRVIVLLSRLDLFLELLVLYVIIYQPGQ